MMNIRKFFKVRNYYLLLGVIMINVGCTKNFLEYNTNPNETAMTDGMMNVCLQRHSEFREES